MISISLLRQPRVGPFAVFDLATAYLGILILSPLLTWLFSKIHLHLSFVSWLWLTLPISVVFHLIFRQDTPLMKMMSDPSKLEFYLVLVVLIFMTYMGLKDINNLSK